MLRRPLLPLPPAALCGQSNDAFKLLLRTRPSKRPVDGHLFDVERTRMAGQSLIIRRGPNRVLKSPGCLAFPVDGPLAPPRPVCLPTAFRIPSNVEGENPNLTSISAARGLLRSVCPLIH